MKWYAVPAVSDMASTAEASCIAVHRLMGGTWLQLTRISDVDKYNLTLKIAQKLGLDTSHENTLWRDKVLTAMTEAVLWSFETDGVKITDHFSASLEFLQFCRNEQDQARDVQGRGLGWC